MKKEELKINTPVIYWKVIKVTGEKFDPVFATVTGSAWTLPGGPELVNISGQSGGVNTDHLYPLHMQSFVEAIAAGMDTSAMESDLNVQEEIRLICGIIRIGKKHRETDGASDKQLVDDFMSKTKVAGDKMGEALKNADIELTEEPKPDYEPFGAEWEAEVMKLPKKAIIELYRGVAIKLKIAEKDAAYKRITQKEFATPNDLAYYK